jgi:localization factor PodJL
MARAFPAPETSEIGLEPETGEWQALRGELVALLDQVESRYTPEDEPQDDFDGLARRVRALRSQVREAPGTARRREALRSVKRAVDRFSERTEPAEDDDLASAIAEIRSRQGANPAPMLARRGIENAQLVELTGLVSGLSGRLERLESELRRQRGNAGSVREVAGQVEQLTQVVELLAGAVGETGQVKRLEAQLANLATMVENAPKVDLAAVNTRLDEVSATVGKLAELQVQQMEREIVREESPPTTDPEVAASMRAIEDGVRNVYDRLDTLERVSGLPMPDLERLSGEMAAITAAVEAHSAPDALAGKIDTLSEQISGFEDRTGDVAALRKEMTALRDAVLKGIEPRFAKLETQIEALGEKIAQPAGEAPNVARIEEQLQALMTRLDDTGTQLDGLSKLYGNQKPQGGGMGKTEMTALADLVARRTSEVVGKSGSDAAVGAGALDAIEARMSALINTAGKDTAERLARLEATLSGRGERPASAAAASPSTAAPAGKQSAGKPSPASSGKDLDTILAALAESPRSGGEGPARDVMPANPNDERPLIDESFKPQPARTASAEPSANEAKSGVRPQFDPATVERPPRPVSSLAESKSDPFAASAPSPASVSAPEPSSTAMTGQSTFIAAARRAQRAKQDMPETEAKGANSLIGRALSRVMGPGAAKAETAPAKEEPIVVPEVKAPETPAPERKRRKSAVAATIDDETTAIHDEDASKESFLSRNRRPILLAAALVAVSTLALNLVLERMPAAPADTASAPTVEPAATPDPADEPEEISSAASLSPALDATPVESNATLTAPRIAAVTGSIDPALALSFAKASEGVPMPAALAATDMGFEPEAAATDDSILTGSIPDSPVDFAPPPEGVGPEALRQAAADGDARAQFEVAAILTEGRAVEQDLAGAAKWYERAAAQGFAPAQYRLGNLYESGNGLEKNLELARLWYQRAAEAGNRMAMHNLAAIHASGALGAQNFETAAEWFERAAERGMTDSQFNLGMLYARGLGVEQSFEDSYKWFSIAAGSGDADAAKARDDIARSLTAEAVNRIDTELEGWTGTKIDLAANYAPIGTWSADFDPGEPISNIEVVTKVQEALAMLGYDIGTPDGLIGPKTREAIRAFEQATGMSESGLVNPRLLAVLGSQPV